MKVHPHIKRLREDVLIPLISGEHIPQDGAENAFTVPRLLLPDNTEHALGKEPVFPEYIGNGEQELPELVINNNAVVNRIVVPGEVLSAHPFKDCGFCSCLSH